MLRFRVVFWLVTSKTSWVLDVTPLSLGIETLNDVATKLIERNTTIPTKKSQVFSTAADSQTSVEVHVIQGEREMASDNRTLGRFHLVGIPPAPRGVPQIEVTFDIDANGITHVSAKDLGTGKEQKITISGSGGISEDEIDRMVKDAQSHSDEDKKRREGAEVRNQLDSLVYSTEKLVAENGDKVDAAVKAEIESAVEEGKAALEGDEPDTMKAAVEKITQVSHKLAEQMYQATAASEGAPGGEPTADAGGAADSSSDEEVIDAEYVDVDEKAS